MKYIKLNTILLKIAPVFAGAILLLYSCTDNKSQLENANSEVPKTQIEAPKEVDKSNMVWIPGGEFLQGAINKGEYRREYPLHKSKVNGFWMDKTEVTNAQFMEFVNATNYVTVAERDIDWEVMKNQVAEGTPKPADSLLKAGSLIFNPPNHKIALNDITQWWKWKTGANWRHPEGPESSIENRMNHPVVQVALEDVLAYCKWAGKRLPTEAEWEFASRGGLATSRFSWGDQAPKEDSTQWANIWHGDFPYNNSALDGYTGTAPVAQFPPNGYGLYDMAGNVWEICSDFYSINYYDQFRGIALCDNPKGPKKTYNPQNPYEVERVHKGGSFLCHYTYCENYRNSSREGIAEDTGLPHSGFRCVVDK